MDVKEIADHYIEGTPQVSEVPVDPDEETPSRIIGSDTEDSSVREGTVRYDIRFLASAPNTGEPIRLILNVEAQNDFYPGYPLIKRGMYYCSRMVSSQYGTVFTESHYENIRKVYSIWICMNPPTERRNSITRYRMTEENLIGAVMEPLENYDLMTAVMICLGSSSDKNYNGTLKLLDVLLSDEIGSEEKRKTLQNDFDIPMTKTLDREVNLMCNLSKGVWEKGRVAGMEEGVLKDIRNLMKTMKLSSDQAMQALQIPESEQPRFEELLKA